MQTSHVTRCIFRDAVGDSWGESAGETVGATGAGRDEIVGEWRRTYSHGLPNK